MENQIVEKIEAVFGEKESVIARDLKLNLLRFVSESSLEPQDRYLAGLAVAQATRVDSLVEIFEAALREGAGPEEKVEEQINEAKESAAVMAMLNTYYRFRHMVGNSPSQNSDEYKNAGLRMTGLAKPMLGKKRFEMLAFAVSVINGCETCIQSHERVLKEAGLSADQIHDLARVAAVTRGIQQLL